MQSLRKLPRYIFPASLFLCSLMLLVLGPSLQQHILALLNSSSSSIYQSVYKDAMISFPDFRTWLYTQNYSSYFIGAFTLTIGLMCSKTTRGAFIISMVIAFLFMMGLDIWIQISNQDLKNNFLAESFISNLIGAPIFASILIVIVWLSQKINSETSEHILIAKLVASIMPAVIGIFLVLLQYYILALLFNPAPSNVEAKIIPKSNATYILSDEMRKKFELSEQDCACRQETKSKV